MGVCYIVGAADFSESFKPLSNDLVIAADGGYDNLLRIGVVPDVLIGDFDSIRALPSGVETLRYPCEKDDTDTYLAYREGVRRGYADFVIFGGVGGRVDHTLANYALLLHSRKAGHRVTLVGGGTETCVLINEGRRVSLPKGATVSVFAMNSVANGVTIKGLKYTVENATLTEDVPLGVSNSSLGEEGYIEVKDGALLVISEVSSFA